MKDGKEKSNGYRSIVIQVRSRKCKMLFPRFQLLIFLIKNRFKAWHFKRFSLMLRYLYFVYTTTAKRTFLRVFNFK